MPKPKLPHVPDPPPPPTNVVPILPEKPKVWMIALDLKVYAYPAGNREITLWIAPFARHKDACVRAADIEAAFARPRTYKSLSFAMLTSTSILESQGDPRTTTPNYCVVLPVSPLLEEFLADFERIVHKALIKLLERDLEMLKSIANGL